ncbi:recombinase family protein [Clostridium algidicarnis]|uniref:recombinase family protein n=1 Tax=Clostridium algidicarnis TaxID=37659 RepID=UPI001C0B9734|nr:recombinase family protein [Clostridium algidicarnis]MBU3209763.1 recombinase family protein [Clostridium algidicarnis]
MIFGYMRISTQKEKQTTDRQRITLEQYAKDNSFVIHEIVEERISGTVKADDRNEYKGLKAKLREGDILIITDIDRLGRNADDVILEFKNLKANSIRVIALDTPYLNEWKKIQDNSLYNMIADIFITLKAHMAQQEREKTITRINQGLSVAKAQGTVIGRPKVKFPKDFVNEYTKFLTGSYGMSSQNFAKMLGIGRSTLYKYIKLFKENISNHA